MYLQFLLVLQRKPKRYLRLSVDCRMSAKLVIAAIVIRMATGQEFQGYNCNDPKDAKFYRHDECSLHKGHLVSEDYFVIQENTRRNISATRCELFVTTRVGYCGHYR